jgi:hypothetical protein
MQTTISLQEERKRDVTLFRRAGRKRVTSPFAAPSAEEPRAQTGLRGGKLACIMHETGTSRRIVATGAPGTCRTYHCRHTRRAAARP